MFCWSFECGIAFNFMHISKENDANFLGKEFIQIYDAVGLDSKTICFNICQLLVADGCEIFLPECGKEYREIVSWSGGYIGILKYKGKLI